jgi:hypothetical protein
VARVARGLGHNSSRKPSMSLNQALIKNYLFIAGPLFVVFLIVLIKGAILASVVFGALFLYASIVKIAAMLR